MVKLIEYSCSACNYCPHLNHYLPHVDTSEIKFFEISLPKKLIEDSASIASLEKNIMEHIGLSNGERALIEWDGLKDNVAIRSTRLAVFSKDSSRFIH